jgi:phi13 family phage major tail protein
MPTFGLRGAKVAKYNNENGAVTYDAPIGAGCAINVQLELTFAEARLYACDNLAEYLREALGGNITFEAKYFPQAAQQLMFGATVKSRTVSYQADGETVSKTITSIVDGADDSENYVGFAAYCPDMIDGAKKWTAFVVPKVKFSKPNSNYQTKSDSITFQTPTTTGAFAPDDTAGKVIREVAVCDSEAEAQAWCAAVFPAA